MAALAKANTTSDHIALGLSGVEILLSSRRRISQSGAYIPIDPVLLQEDQEATTARTQQLEARVLALEGQVAASRQETTTAPPGPARGGQGTGSRGRGGCAQRCRRLAAATPADIEDVEDGDANEVFCPNANAIKDTSDPLKLVSPQHRQDLSALQRQALSKCQAVVQAAFREVTGVLTAKDPWPKWTESEEWTGPGIAKDAATHAVWMNAPDVKLTIGLLIKVAKATFRGFKTVFLAQEDTAAKERLDANARASRWLNRRRKKPKNYRSAIPTYMEIYGGADPTDLVIPDLMSDEASGPEDDDTESLTQWKRRMAEKDGSTGMSDDVLRKKQYLETVKPNWRSDELTEIYHNLCKLWYDALSVRFATAMTPRISNLNRATNTPPPYAPYNFGINQTWFDEYKDEPTYKILLRTWGKYPNPPGFGTNTIAGAAAVEADTGEPRAEGPTAGTEAGDA
ncbi:hypothetical protein C2E23DRAFT_886589 [Lenzites betulinus]|nr:hypothetical protein C2E23DRAFT_886589 [Lenzites betulinus]